MEMKEAIHLFTNGLIEKAFNVLSNSELSSLESKILEAKIYEQRGDESIFKAKLVIQEVILEAVEKKDQLNEIDARITKIRILSRLNNLDLLDEIKIIKDLFSIFRIRDDDNLESLEADFLFAQGMVVQWHYGSLETEQAIYDSLEKYEVAIQSYRIQKRYIK